MCQTYHSLENLPGCRVCLPRISAEPLMFLCFGVASICAMAEDTMFFISFNCSLFSCQTNTLKCAFTGSLCELTASFKNSLVASLPIVFSLEYADRIAVAIFYLPASELFSVHHQQKCTDCKYDCRAVTSQSEGKQSQC